MRQFTQNKLLVLLVAILLIVNLGLMLYFFVVRSDYKKEAPHQVSDFIQKQLGFNADQTARFRELRDQHKEAVKPVIDDIKKIKDSLYSLLQKPEVNDSIATSFINEISEKQKEWELMIFHHFQKMRAICDSSQLPKFDSLVHQMVMHGSWTHKKTNQ